MGQSSNGAKNYFKCFELFYRTGNGLPTELKCQYYDALMEYGLYGTEPSDPIILSLLQGAIYSIDKFGEHRKKTSESMIGNSNAVQTWEKHQKQIETDCDRGKQFLSDGNNKKEKKIKKEKNKSVSLEELVEAFKSDTRINKIFYESDVREWLTFKQNKRELYATVTGFIQQLVVAKRTVENGQPRLDTAKRFNFAVNNAISKNWQGIHWYDETERDYLASKRDLFSNLQEDG